MGREGDSSRFKVLSLFSGGMGLDLGLHATGRFETVACIEIDPACCRTIERNRNEGKLPKSLQVLQADIAQLDPVEALSKLQLDPEDIDVVAGGPPCQSFSTAGRRRTVIDPRGTLLWDFLRFLEKIKPKAFLMENVRGLLSAALVHRPIAERPDKGGPELTDDELPGSVVRLFAKDLANLKGVGYNLDVFEVNSVNYGSPQIRERALFLGNRFGLEFNFPEPDHGPPWQNEESNELDLFTSQKTKLKEWKTLREALAGLNDSKPVLLDFSPRKKNYLAMIPEGSNWRSLPESLQKESMGKAWYAKGGRSGWWRRLTYDLPSPTLVTMPNHASTSLCHPTETRALSLKEYARIQEFPDEWEFEGTTAQKYAQAGNAVPIRLGKIAGEVIADVLDQIEDNHRTMSQSIAEKPRIVYLQSHVRTRQWFKDGKTYIWNSEVENGDAEYALPKTLRKERRI